MAPETKHKQFGEILRQRALGNISEVIMAERFSALLEHLQAKIAQLEEEIEALQKELIKDALRFHSQQYCKCNWCQMAKDQALQKGGKRMSRPEELQAQEKPNA